MKLKYWLFGFSCFVDASLAAGPAVQHQFQAGQKAVAAQVNANFQELADRISAIPGAITYAYQNYGGSNVSEKVFATTGTMACGNTETRTYSRTPEGSNTRIVETHVQRNGTTACRYRTVEQIATPTAVSLRNWADYNPSDTTTALRSVTLNSPVPRLTSTMALGSSWGSSSDATSTPTGDRGLSEQNTLLAVESVTVPYGTFSDCLKIQSVRSSTTFGRFIRTAWHCPNIGVVKHVQHFLADGQLLQRELSTMTTN